MKARRQTMSLLHEKAIRPSDEDLQDLEAQIDAWTVAGRVTCVVEDLVRLNVRSVMRLVVGRVDAELERRLATLLAVLTPVVEKGTGLSRLGSLVSRSHRRAQRGERDMARVLARVVASSPGDSLAPRLLASGIDEATVLNLTTALMLAGALVPAAAGAWVLALLAAHPDWQERARNHTSARSAVVSESLRLYPPTWLVTRTVAHDGVYAGWSLRQGDEVVLSPYISHRRPDVFEDPTAFRPDRWIGSGAVQRPPSHHYFPYGAGARRCVAAGLATRRLEMLIEGVTATSVVSVSHLPRSASTTSTLLPEDLTLHVATRHCQLSAEQRQE